MRLVGLLCLEEVYEKTENFKKLLHYKTPERITYGLFMTFVT